MILHLEFSIATASRQHFSKSIGDYVGKFKFKTPLGHNANGPLEMHERITGTGMSQAETEGKRQR